MQNLNVNYKQLTKKTPNESIQNFRTLKSFIEVIIHSKMISLKHMMIFYCILALLVPLGQVDAQSLGRPTGISIPPSIILDPYSGYSSTNINVRIYASQNQQYDVWFDTNRNNRLDESLTSASQHSGRTNSEGRDSFTLRVPTGLSPGTYHIAGYFPDVDPTVQNTFARFQLRASPVAGIAVPEGVASTVLPTGLFPSLQFSRPFYSPDQPIGLDLVCPSMNTDQRNSDTYTGIARVRSGTAGADLNMAETGANTGIFGTPSDPPVPASIFVGSTGITTINAEVRCGTTTLRATAQVTDSASSSGLAGISPSLRFTQSIYSRTQNIGLELICPSMNLDQRNVDRHDEIIQVRSDHAGADLSVDESGTNTGTFTTRRDPVISSELFVSSTGITTLNANARCGTTTLRATAQVLGSTDSPTGLFPSLQFSRPFYSPDQPIGLSLVCPTMNTSQRSIDRYDEIIQVRSGHAGTILSADETGTNTAVFATLSDPPVPASIFVGSTGITTINAEVRCGTTTLRATAQVTDSASSSGLAGISPSLRFSRLVYSPDQPIGLDLVCPSMNTDQRNSDTYTGIARVRSGTAGADLNMAETGANTGIFGTPSDPPVPASIFVGSTGITTINAEVRCGTTTLRTTAQVNNQLAEPDISQPIDKSVLDSISKSATNKDTKKTDKKSDKKDIKKQAKKETKKDKPSSQSYVKQDSDQDGIPDPKDNCPKISNKNQQDSDKDGIGDKCDKTQYAEKEKPEQKSTKSESYLPQTKSDPDSDQDGVPDYKDNCAKDYNLDQADSDFDGIGDTCDPTPYGDKSEKSSPSYQESDSDQDGIPDSKDNCTYAYNPDQADGDFNGVGDACDSAQYGGKK